MLSSYCPRVDVLEAATGYDLLSALPTSVPAQLKAKTDTGLTN